MKTSRFTLRFMPSLLVMLLAGCQSDSNTSSTSTASDSSASTSSSDTSTSSSSTSSTSTSTSSSSTTTVTTTSTCQSTSSQGVLLTCLANNFLATLSSSEQASVQYALISNNATQYWSNLPTTLVKRHGIPLSNLSTSAKTAAETLINTALTQQGQNTMSELRLADGYLGNYQSGYGKDLYYISFLGTPSTSSPWVLEFTGHHYTIHVSVNGDQQVSLTPSFVGVEPVKWSDGSTTHTPMSTNHDALLAMLNGLSSSQLASAKLSQAYDDVLVGPQKDGSFPSTQQGLAVSGLSSSQKALVKAAINSYAADANTQQAADYITDDALAQTYVAWASYSDLATKGSYVRIDGPKVWIELIVQSGVVFPANHYHSIWRDKTNDYGGNFTF